MDREAAHLSDNIRLWIQLSLWQTVVVGLSKSQVNLLRVLALTSPVSKQPPASAWAATSRLLWLPGDANPALTSQTSRDLFWPGARLLDGIDTDYNSVLSVLRDCLLRKDCGCLSGGVFLGTMSFHLHSISHNCNLPSNSCSFYSVLCGWWPSLVGMHLQALKGFVFTPNGTDDLNNAWGASLSVHQRHDPALLFHCTRWCNLKTMSINMHYSADVLKRFGSSVRWVPARPPSTAVETTARRDTLRSVSGPARPGRWWGRAGGGRRRRARWAPPGGSSAFCRGGEGSSSPRRAAFSQGYRKKRSRAAPADFLLCEIPSPPVAEPGSAAVGTGAFGGRSRAGAEGPSQAAAAPCGDGGCFSDVRAESCGWAAGLLALGKNALRSAVALPEVFRAGGYTAPHSVRARFVPREPSSFPVTDLSQVSPAPRPRHCASVACVCHMLEINA